MYETSPPDRRRTPYEEAKAAEILSPINTGWQSTLFWLLLAKDAVAKKGVDAKLCQHELSGRQRGQIEALLSRVWVSSKALSLSCFDRASSFRIKGRGTGELTRADSDAHCRPGSGQGLPSLRATLAM